MEDLQQDRGAAVDQAHQALQHATVALHSGDLIEAQAQARAADQALERATGTEGYLESLKAVRAAKAKWLG